jgi:hypothetical protein
MDLSQYPPEIIKKAKDKAKIVAKEFGYYITWVGSEEIITDARGYNLSDADLSDAQDRIVKELLERGLD